VKKVTNNPLATYYTKKTLCYKEVHYLWLLEPEEAQAADLSPVVDFSSFSLSSLFSVSDFYLSKGKSV